MKEFLDMFKRGFDFNGRSTRREFWVAFAFMILAEMVFSLIVSGMPAGVQMSMYSLISIVLFIPILSLQIRRLHDIGKSGYYLFMSLIPIVGPFIVLAYFCTKGQETENKYVA